MDLDLTKCTQILYVTSNNILHSYVKSFFFFSKSKVGKEKKKMNYVYYEIHIGEWEEPIHLTVLNTFCHK